MREWGAAAVAPADLRKEFQVLWVVDGYVKMGARARNFAGLQPPSVSGACSNKAHACKRLTCTMSPSAFITKAEMVD